MLTIRDKIDIKIYHILGMLCHLEIKTGFTSDIYLKMTVFSIMEDIREKISDENIFEIIKEILELEYKPDDFDAYFSRFKKLFSREDGILSRKRIFSPTRIRDLRTQKSLSEQNKKKEDEI